MYSVIQAFRVYIIFSPLYVVFILTIHTGKRSSITQHFIDVFHDIL